MTNALPLSILITIIPTLLWFLFYYSKDRRDPEPLNTLSRAFLWGMISAAILLGLQWYIVRHSELSIIESLQNRDISQTGIVFIFALLEESIKGACVFWLIYRFRATVNQYLDGIILGMSVALGFAFVENVIYFIDLFPLLSRWDFLVTYLFRTLGTTFAHTIFTGLLGYFVAFGVIDLHSQKHVIKKSEKLFHSLKDFVREILTFHTIYQHILSHKPSEKGHFLFGIFIESLFLSTLLHFIFNLFLSSGIFKHDLVFLTVPFLFLLGSYVLKQFKDRQALKLHNTAF